jgi:hypothetical protein
MPASTARAGAKVTVFDDDDGRRPTLSASASFGRGTGTGRDEPALDGVRTSIPTGSTLSIDWRAIRRSEGPAAAMDADDGTLDIGAVAEGLAAPVMGTVEGGRAMPTEAEGKFTPGTRAGAARTCVADAVRSTISLRAARNMCSVAVSRVAPRVSMCGRADRSTTTCACAPVL